MSWQPGGGGRPIRRVIERFREKGATSPEKAMTAQELGLPPRFEDAMHRRLGATGIFVEVNGKYYLDEAKLAQVRAAWREGGEPRGRTIALRMARMALGVLVILLIIVNILVVRSAYLSLTIVALLFLWVGLTAYQIYRLSRVRRRWRESQAGGAPQ